MLVISTALLFIVFPGLIRKQFCKTILFKNHWTSAFFKSRAKVWHLSAVLRNLVKTLSNYYTVQTENLMNDLDKRGNK